ncbi:MAG: domain-/G-beta repeat/PBS lyase HEAT-like repeat-containing protein, partial [Myxococcaceae bacterium]|nr:domain-/G-beta repeat/PBS lyase HEAT-like repeat-containing protein [Myxococcaceae bacterium]
LTTALLAAERRGRARWLVKRGDERIDEAATWRRLVWALSRLGSPNVAIAFRTLLGETDSPAAVRAEAARGLGALGAQASAHADALVLAMSSTDLELREAAAAALVSIDAARAAQAVVTVRPFDPIAFGPQLRIFTPTPEAMNSSEGRRLGLPSILAIADKGTRPAISGHVSALIHLAAVGSKGDDGTRLEAVMALGRIGGDEAIAYLKTLAFEAKGASEAVRKAAFRSLRRAQRRLAKTEDRLSSSDLEESVE